MLIRVHEIAYRFGGPSEKKCRPSLIFYCKIPILCQPLTISVKILLVISDRTDKFRELWLIMCDDYIIFKILDHHTRIFVFKRHRNVSFCCQTEFIPLVTWCQVVIHVPCWYVLLLFCTWVHSHVCILYIVILYFQNFFLGPFKKVKCAFLIHLFFISFIKYRNKTSIQVTVSHCTMYMKLIGWNWY